MYNQDNPDHDLTNNVKSCIEKEKRVKPVIPAKPTFIPPPANNRQSMLVQATSSQRSTTFRSISNIENQQKSPHPARAKCSKSTTSHIVPSSPNLVCANDCCGIPLPGTSSKQQTNHNHNNNNNNIKETCKQVQRPTDHTRSSNDSLDCSSSISSNSGGFKDPDYIARQNEFERNNHLESGKLNMVIGDIDSRFNFTASSIEKPSKEPQSTVVKTQLPESTSQQEQSSNRNMKTAQNTFFQQSTKQLEQMLAQRIEKENRCVQQQHQNSKKKRITTTTGTSRTETTTGNCVQDQITSSQASSSLSKQEPNISTLQKQFQHRLHDEMKLHCKSIQEKHLIEKRWPQEHYKPACEEDVSVNYL